MRTGVCAYIASTLLLLLFKRYEVSTVEIHLDSVDNLSDRKKARLWKKGSKVLFKNDQSEGLETLTSCKVVK